eukprot:jgi/Mesvir1/28171/Mv04731-RA.1
MHSSYLRHSAGVASAARAFGQVFNGGAIRSQATIAPSLAEATYQKPGLFTRVFGAPGPVGTPLTVPLAGVKLPPPLDLPSSLPPTEKTVLSNGFTIASENTPGSTATVGLYIDSGSVYESPVQTGVSHLLEHMAFKSTANRSHFRLLREADVIGAHLLASASHEEMAYTVDGLNAHAPQMVELLADAVRNPAFHRWEVEEQLAKMSSEAAELKNNTQHAVMQGLQSTAFTGGLSRPLPCPEKNVANLHAGVCREFVAANYTAPRMVLAASGIPHETLVKLAEPLFGDMPKVAREGAPASQYVGGDWRAAIDSSETGHVALGFLASGGWQDVDGTVLISVIQMLMGGGGTFSAGGPGKGMHSRLYRRVLSQHPEVQSCTAFSNAFNNTAVFGIHGSVAVDSIPGLVEVMCRELKALTLTAGTDAVTEEELARAKAATISSALMNLESRVVTCEDIGRQILSTGTRNLTSAFTSKVQAITLADVRAAATKMLKTPPTFAAAGDSHSIPRYEAICEQFM